MEYNQTKEIDLLIKKKIFNSAIFNSKYKDIIKEHKNDLYQVEKRFIFDENNMLGDYYNIEPNTTYDGFSFINSKSEGFTDNEEESIKEGFSFTIPGSPGLPGTSPWYWRNCSTNHAGVCYGYSRKCGGGSCGCCNWGCCCETCGDYLDSWPCAIEYCTSGHVAGTDGIPGIPSWTVNFPDVPSFSDMFNQVKDKINSDVIEPMENEIYHSYDDIEEFLREFFQDYEKEILSFLVFIFFFLFTIIFTENNTIVTLLSLLISSMFLICIRNEQS